MECANVAFTWRIGSVSPLRRRSLLFSVDALWHVLLAVLESQSDAFVATKVIDLYDAIDSRSRAYDNQS